MELSLQRQIDPSSRRPTVVSVVSGKGGCGKTLLSAVLGLALAREGKQVLLVDMDIFVRGLTILLASFRSSDRRTEGRTVSDFLGTTIDGPSDQSQQVQTFRFMECDVMPACKGVADPLDYDEASLSSFDFASRSIQAILSTVGSNYDLILLDCRAGIDSLVLAACRLSQLVLSIAEDDDVCLQANTNLVNDLRYRNKISDVFTIINKGRRTQSVDELREGVRRPDLNYAGVVPFDIEIMQDFGKDRLWGNVFSSLYFQGLLASWNYIAKSASVPALTPTKYSFAPRVFGAARSGRHALVERMLRVYGVTAIAASLGWFMWKSLPRIDNELHIANMLPTLGLLFGVGMLYLSTTPVRHWLLGSSDKPRIIESESRHHKVRGESP